MMPTAMPGTWNTRMARATVASSLAGEMGMAACALAGCAAAVCAPTGRQNAVARNTARAAAGWGTDFTYRSSRAWADRGEKKLTILFIGSFYPDKASVEKMQPIGGDTVRITMEKNRMLA